MVLTLIIDTFFFRCSSILDGDGSIRLLNFGEVENIMQNVVRPMSATGLTTICIAYKNYMSGMVTSLNFEA